MVTTRRMSTGATPAKRAASPSTPSRRRSTSTSKAAAPATPSGSRTPRRGGASKAAAAAKSTAGGSGASDFKTKGLRLAVKALGIYACFIYWGIVQERVTTTDYQPGPGLGGRPGRFSSMISLNGAWGFDGTLIGRFGWMC